VRAPYWREVVPKSEISKIIHKDSLRPENPIGKSCQSKNTLENGRFEITLRYNIRAGSPNRESCQSETVLEKLLIQDQFLANW
jgi:hypothetical protein